MYFAVDPTSPTLPAQIAQEIAVLRAQHTGVPFHLIALLDGAFDEQFFKSPFRRQWPRQSLYANTSLQGLGTAAPQLTTFRSPSGEPTRWLQGLFSQCSGKPMLSIVASALDAEALQRHLLPYLICRTEDTVEWPVRWGDTRVLPGLLESLTVPQREHLLAPVYCWWSVSRSGDALKWQGSGNEHPGPAAFDRLPMDDGTFAALVDQSEADAVLSSIFESQPDLLRDRSPVHVHQAVSHHLKVATAHRIDGPGARQHFSALALMLPDDFTQHPAMAEGLTRIRNRSEYFAEIAKLPPSFWDLADEGQSEISKS